MDLGRPAVGADLGAPTVLVNNAGHNPTNGILETSEADWHRVLNLNLKAYFL